jgi:paraquat-inducible protein B
MAQSNYFKIGVFVLTGVGLLVGVIVIVAGSALFEKRMRAETYFNESVQGLDIGGPVKYRGVTIGRVKSIGFVKDKYPPPEGFPQPWRYVYVEMDLDPRSLAGLDLPFNDHNAITEQIISSGMRIRLTTQGLTGVAFLELSFYDPLLNPPLPINWTPHLLYFPSAPSTLSRIESAVESMGRFMRDIDTIDFKEIAQTINGLIHSMDKALAEANVKDFGQLLVQSTTELRDALKRVNKIVHGPGTETLLPDAAQAMASAKTMLQSGEKDFVATMGKARSVAEHLDVTAKNVENLLANPALKKSAEALPETLDNVRKASDDMRRSAVELERLLRNVNGLVTDERADIAAILDDTKTLIQNFNELTGDLKRNPGRLILSDPPRKVNPEKLP